jgi:hypothetical protein
MSDLEDVARRLTEALNRRDFDAALAAYSRYAVMDLSPQGLGVFEGHEAIRGLMKDWVQLYEDYRAELEEFRDLGNGMTFSVVLHRGRPARSSSFVEVRHAYTAISIDGLITKQTNYPDIDEARRVAERMAEELG